MPVTGDDELARLAESHNRLAADLAAPQPRARPHPRRHRRGLAARRRRCPRRPDGLRRRRRPSRSSTRPSSWATRRSVEEEEVVPGVSRPLRAVLRAGGEDLGVLIGRLPATRRWERADQDLLELFASEMAAAIRNAQLFATVEIAEPAAPRARRRQGRLPARRQPQPADAADEHPGLRRAARRGRPGSPPRDHRRAVGAPVADGPPAPDRHPPGVRRAPATQRGRRPGLARPQGVGGPRRRRRRRSRLDDAAGGWLAIADARPARPGPVGAPRQRGQVRRRQSGQRDGRPPTRCRPARSG